MKVVTEAINSYKVFTEVSNRERQGSFSLFLEPQPSPRAGLQVSRTSIYTVQYVALTFLLNNTETFARGNLEMLFVCSLCNKAAAETAGVTETLTYSTAHTGNRPEGTSLLHAVEVPCEDGFTWHLHGAKQKP